MDTYFIPVVCSPEDALPVNVDHINSLDISGKSLSAIAQPL
jgi:hypothetical protein